MDPRFPVGRFTRIPDPSPSDRSGWIEEIRQLPIALGSALRGITEQELDSPYRPEGWTVRQVVHHLADSHINAYIRLRLALTEEMPVVKTYDEKAWADLPDARGGPIEPSLAMLQGLHARMTELFGGLSETDLGRVMKHPEIGEMRVEDLLQLYAWHGRHHVAHVESVRAM